MRSSTRRAIIFVAVCAALLLVWMLHPRPGPPQQAIADQLDYAVAGANAHSPSRVASIISQDYSDSDNMTATGLRVLLVRGLSNGSDAVTKMTPPSITVSGDTATSDSTLIVTGNGGQSLFNRPVHLTWHLERGTAWLVFPMPVWRVVKADYGSALDFGE